MIKTGLVEQVYIDYRLQRLLYRHAKRLGHSQEELKTWFSYPYARGGLIWHLKGHADHLHVRFKAPSSEASGAALVREEGRRSLRPRPRYGRVKPQDTLRAIAKRYRVPLKALSRWNRLTPNPKLKPKRSRLVVGFHTPWHIAKRARMFSKTKAEGSAEGS
jgi:penicillin-insensitive murein endopeptidase